MSTRKQTTLTVLQQQVVLALAKGITVSDAADAAGLHRTTIYNWMKTSQEFDQAFSAARSMHPHDLSDRMEELTSSAISALREILEDPKAPAAVRLRAALAVLKANFNRTSLGPNPLASVSNQTETEPPQHVNHVETVEFVENVEFAKRTQVPRNALCPCGSGHKFKRCCGRDAPAVLFPAGDSRSGVLN